MTEEERNAIIADMVRERRTLRATVACLCERLEKSSKALQIGSGIAERGAKGLHNAQTPQFETTEYPTAAELRAMVAELNAARERIGIIDERLNECG